MGDKKIHFHSSDARFCGSTQTGRQFTLDPNAVTCGQCKNQDTQSYRCTIKGCEDFVLDAFEIAALEINKPTYVVGNVLDHFVPEAK